MALEAIFGSILGELVTLTANSLRGALGVEGGLTDQLDILQMLLVRIQSLLADAEERQIRDEAVRMWLDDLRKAAYDADVVVDQFNYEILRHRAAQVAAQTGLNNMVASRQVSDFSSSHNMVVSTLVSDFFSSHNQILFQLKMGRKLKNILNRIEKIESEGRMFNFEVSNVQQKTAIPMRETSSFVVQSDVVGRDEDREKIVKMLIENSENLAVLPIVGMEGLGKTTMAQLIYNDTRVMDHFQLRVWVCVSDQWDMTKIIQDLTVSITGNRELPFLGSMQLVREELMGKRYLIILDDLWEEDPAEWNNLRSILDCGGRNGSAIIVTTCNQRVAQIMGTRHNYHLPVLSEDESWTLFKSKAFALGGAEKSEELVEIGKAIVKKCGGLPLAIKMLGSSLYMKNDRNDWLKFRDSGTWMEENDNILPLLRVIYKRLPSYTKRCFAFCVTFPKDYLIEKEMLIQMWIAHGFIPSEERLDVKGNEIFNQLVQRFFLHEIKEGKKEYASLYAPEKHKDDRHDPFTATSCKMHHLTHDLAQYIVRDELYKWSPEESTRMGVYYLSIGDVDHKETKREFKNYGTSIQFFCMEEVTANFLESTLSRFSISTRSLQHLRYLQLSSVQIRELPDYIFTLHLLQTLDLFRCYQLRRLPESLCTLFNLQTLNLRGCTNLCELPERMQCMSGLRNLYLDRCYKLRKMPARMGGMAQLQQLTMYVVSNEDGRGIKELERLNLSSKLEIYNLRHVKDAEEAREVRLHSKDLYWLTLCWREVDYVLPSDYNDTTTNYLNQDNVLKELKPPGGINVLKIWDYHGSNFPDWIMRCLKLVQLHLGYCTRIDRLPPLWRLKSLEVLSLRRLDNLKYIISEEEDAAGDTTVLPYPSLKTLRLCSLRKLEGWWENRNAAQATAICFPSLVELEIEKCPELAGSMPLLSCVKDLKLKESNEIRLGNFLPDATSSCRHLQGLEKLSIRKCEDVVLMWPELNNFGSCLKDIEIMECDWMFSSKGSGLWRCMASLEILTIFECHALVDMFEVLQGLNSLRKLEILVSLIVLEATSTMDVCLPPHLEEFSFFSCESVRKLVLRCPASLNCLDICGCPNLVSLTAAAQEKGQVTSLKFIRLHDCCKLKSLELEMGGDLIALRDLTITDCTPLISLPQCLLRCLPRLEQLEIGGCPELDKKCTSRGEYYQLVSDITKRRIGRGAESSPTHFIVTSRRLVCFLDLK